MFEGRLALGLEGDNNKANKDVDHEEGYDDDVDKVENCYGRPEGDSIVPIVLYIEV